MRFVEIADVAGLFEGCGSIVISSHVNPDGDACGSSLAMYQVLVGLGKDVRVIFTSSVPSNMRFLPGAEFVELYDGSVHDDVIVGADLLLVLDCNAPSRLMRMEGVVLRREKPILVVDHHESPAEFADFYRVDVDSSSTCELVWEIGSFLESRGFGVLSKDFAVCCYTGIMTDTGGFRLNQRLADRDESNYTAYTMFFAGISSKLLRIYEWVQFWLWNNWISVGFWNGARGQRIRS